MRIKHCATVFRMELSTNVPFQCWNFHNLNQIRFRIDSYTFHAVVFKLLTVVIVKFITMAMAFLYVFLFVSLIGFGILINDTFKKLPDALFLPYWLWLLFFHNINNVVRSLFIEFNGIGIRVTQYVAGKLNGNALHA